MRRAPMTGPARPGRQRHWSRAALRLLAGGTLPVAAALCVAVPLFLVANVPGASLILLLAILASAVSFGLAASLLACVLSVVAYDFFFLPPLYSLELSNPDDSVRLVVFAVVAAVASNLAARLRTQARQAEIRAQTMTRLSDFSGKLAGATTQEDVLQETIRELAAMLDAQTTILLPGEDGLAVRERAPGFPSLTPDDLATAQSVWQADRALTTQNGVQFIPLHTGTEIVGVLGIIRPAGSPALNQHEDLLLRVLCNQAAVAIERVNLVQDIHRTRLNAETDRLRSTLLTSISHDLRAPLAAILGCANGLAAGVAPPEQAELVESIQEEAERLNRFISNLMDMSRLESGPLPLANGLADLSDVVGAALRRARSILDGRRVSVRLPPDLPMLELDMVLFEQVLFNLLDNAAKYTAPGGAIEIEAAQAGAWVRLRVTDDGEGIGPAELERIFQKFYRVEDRQRRRMGAGLGLAICRGFVEAMGGRISAGNRTGRPGAVFTILLPVPAQLPVLDEAAP